MDSKISSTDKGARRSHKRSVRNILIHRPMQREFTIVVTTLLIISMMAIGLIIHDTIREAAFGGGFRFGKINPYEVLSEVRYQLIIKVSLVLFATVLVIGFFGVFFLHRVAGPVYRFRQIFIKLNQGNKPNPIVLREGDFFIETAQEINDYLSHLTFESDKQAQIQQRLTAILAANPPDPFKKQIQELKSALEALPPQA